MPKGGYSFIIGNGTSRKGLPLEPLMDYGLLFGCNWFMKDEFRPHVLIASDEPMTKTILKTYSNYPKNNWFYTWYPKPGSGAKKATCPEKFAAGPMGAWVAADTYQSSKVFLIGMDFFGFGSRDKDLNGGLNNLYEGKKHYVKNDDGKAGAPTYRNWQRRFQFILQNFPDTEFWHVNPFEGKSPERLRGFENFHQCSFENLMAHLNDDVELIDMLETTDEDVKLASEQNPDNLRAVIERQIAGQENMIWQDVLSPQEVLNLRVQVMEHYKKNGVKEGQEVGVDILGYRIPIPFFGVREGNITRVPTVKEIEFQFNNELRARMDLMEKSEWFQPPLDIPKVKKKESLAPPPPPPLTPPPPPPPPPPSF